MLTALSYLTGPYCAANRYAEIEAVIQRQLALTRKLDGENTIAFHEFEIHFHTTAR